MIGPAWSEIAYSVSVAPEDESIEGSFSSGDDELDRQTVREISERVERGDPWAWCVVTVHAHAIVGGVLYEGRAHLGGCSYDNEAAFVEPGGYYDDMKSEALDDLRAKVQS